VDLISIEDIRLAAKNVAGLAHRTPLLPAPWAGDLWLKPESLQPVGAFKVRGAAHALAMLPDERRASGVVTHSSGNHGRALAYAAAAAGVRCVVVMPDVAPAVKVDAVRALGAEIELVPPDRRVARVTELVAERGLESIPPFDHRDIIAGQGTVGLEIAEDLPDVEVVLVPVGGGGLASGVATAIKALRPAATVIGVEPELAADAQESLRTGEVVVWPVEQTYRTIADGLRTNLSELTFAHLRARLDGIVTVTEDEIRSAVGTLAREAHLVVEPSGALGIAAVRHRPGELPSGRTVAVLTGGNLDPALLATLLNA
jgi:threonine dehydratase